VGFPVAIVSRLTDELKIPYEDYGTDSVMVWLFVSLPDVAETVIV
jgi:hypothetical protein